MTLAVRFACTHGRGGAKHHFMEAHDVLRAHGAAQALNLVLEHLHHLLVFL